MDDRLTILLKALAVSGKRLGSVDTSAELYQTVFKILKETHPFDKGAILLKDASYDILSIAAAIGYSSEECDKIRVSQGQGITGKALQSGETQLVQETIDEDASSDAVASSEVAIPLKEGDQTLGVINVKSNDFKFDESRQHFFSVFGEQVSAAITRIKLRSRLEQRKKKLVAVSKAGQALTSADSLDDACAKILELSESALAPDACSVQLLDNDGDYLVIFLARGDKREAKGTTIPAELGVGGLATRTMRPSLIPDTSKSEPSVIKISDYLSEIAVPLVYQGDLMGVLHFGHKKANRFNETSLLHATVFADQISTIVGANRLNDKKAKTLKQYKKQIGLFVDVEKKLSAGGETDLLLTELLQLIANALNLTQVAILRVENEDSHFSVESSWGYPDSTPTKHFPRENTIPGEAYRTASTVLVPDVKRDPRYMGNDKTTRSELATPIQTTKSVLGVLLVESARQMDENTVATMQMLALQVASLLTRTP